MTTEGRRDGGTKGASKRARESERVTKRESRGARDRGRDEADLEGESEREEKHGGETGAGGFREKDRNEVERPREIAVDRHASFITIGKKAGFLRRG